jgi:D-beta-D-heptose 7-phosphate kinase / D-beta-D-heptose 1-phosphate adenosyltransferase
MPAAIELVQRFRQLRALVIGDAMLDSYLEGSASRLCTEGPIPVVRRTTEEHVPGGAANAATNLRALGAEVMFLGFVGSDVPGMLLRSALRERDVDDGWLIEDPSLDTHHKLRILADDQYVVRFDSGQSRVASAKAQRQLLSHVASTFSGCDVVIISDYRYGTVTDALLDKLRVLRAARPCPLVVDSKDLRRFHRAAATIVTPNRLEARLAVEPTFHPDSEIRLEELSRIGQQLLSLIDADHAAITMAGDGVLLVHRRGAVEHIPTHPVAHANDVGAGDSFTAALALALAAGGTAVEAARIGVVAGTIAVTRRRTAVVQHQELLQRVSRDEPIVPPSATALARLLEQGRLGGRSVVFTNGVFDILHAGHVHFLRQAKGLGDILVVGVNSDESTRRLKGKNRPINSESDRLALVAALDSVDHVVLFDEDMPTSLIRVLRPDIHVKGGDYAGEALPEAEAVRDVGGEVVILPLHESLSTTSVIDRIVALALEDRDGVQKQTVA